MARAWYELTPSGAMYELIYKVDDVDSESGKENHG